MSKASDVSSYVARQVGILQLDTNARAANLAKLRRGVGKTLEESPETWSMVLSGMPEGLLSKSADCRATEGEKAAYTALTLFALHQQGESRPVNSPGASFGNAIRSLVTPENEEGIKRRFDAVVTSTTIEELSYHARGLVQLMRASDRLIAMDYPRFAKDLYNFQFPDGRRNVILSWGQDYYRIASKNDNDNGDKKESE